MDRSAQQLVVGVDGSAASDGAVRWAVREATLRGLAIRLITVVAPTLTSSVMAPDDTIAQGQLDRAREVLGQARRLIDDLSGENALNVHTKMQYDRVVPSLVDASTDSAMIVVGSRGFDGYGRHMLGSVSSGLLHHAHCPVAVVHDSGPVQHETRDDAPILLGIDGSPASEAATTLAFDEASRRGVPLVALHAWSDVGVFPILGMDWREYRDQGDEVLGERLAGWHETYPEVEVHRRLVCDVPARWLVDESRDAQLVVVGRRGRGGYAGLQLGSVSSAVVQSAHAPVIVVGSAA
jgi:nucleotide-binding universal stress UspA family protein